jgi:hypothetical protein
MYRLRIKDMQEQLNTKKSSPYLTNLNDEKNHHPNGLIGPEKSDKEHHQL